MSLLLVFRGDFHFHIPLRAGLAVDLNLPITISLRLVESGCCHS